MSNNINENLISEYENGEVLMHLYDGLNANKTNKETKVVDLSNNNIFLYYQNTPLEYEIKSLTFKLGLFIEFIDKDENVIINSITILNSSKSTNIETYDKLNFIKNISIKNVYGYRIFPNLQINISKILNVIPNLILFISSSTNGTFTPGFDKYKIFTNSSDISYIYKALSNITINSFALKTSYLLEFLSSEQKILETFKSTNLPYGLWTIDGSQGSILKFESKTPSAFIRIIPIAPVKFMIGDNIRFMMDKTSKPLSNKEIKEKYGVDICDIDNVIVPAPYNLNLTIKTTTNNKNIAISSTNNFPKNKNISNSVPLFNDNVMISIKTNSENFANLDDVMGCYDNFYLYTFVIMILTLIMLYFCNKK